MTRDSLQIRLLGDPRLLHRGRALDLPPSKKTRALLVYLVATRRSHLRERLCDLLWEGPDDPRGALRWSLAKLRPLLNSDLGAQLVTDRERVAFAADGADIDVFRLGELAGGGVDRAPLDTLKSAAALFSGEFAEGLDLPACFRFHEWCSAEREKWAALRLAILTKLMSLLGDSPEEALAYARSKVGIDPLDEAAHIAVISLLATLGRQREAQRQYNYCRQLLEAELGIKPSPALERARASLRPPSPARAAAGVSAPKPLRPPRDADPDIVGRDEECAVLDALAAKAAAGAAPLKLTLLTGDAGIGKTRLLRRLEAAIVGTGGTVFKGRAFEAEMMRPYGVWADILGRVPAPDIPAAYRSDLQPLLSDAAAQQKEGDRTRLFTALSSLINDLARDVPVAVLIDDLQWVDDASISLLHYLIRALQSSSRLVVAATARRGELADNSLAQRMAQALIREGRLVEMPLGPLDLEATTALARPLAPDKDISSVVTASEGNPLFAIELAASLARGDQTLPRSIGGALAEHLSRPEGPARAVLPWAAALGRVFDVSLLARCVTLSASQWNEALDELERRSIIRSVGEDRYDFYHDLIRSAAYGQISQPRRRLIHGEIAEALAAALEAGEQRVLGSELARHAALGGNDLLAARGFALAGEQSLRVFAHGQAVEFAEHGLRHLSRLGEGAQRARLQIALLRVQVLASSGNWRRRWPSLVDDLAGAVHAAEAAGLAADATTGYYLMSELHFEEGDAAGAEASTLRAAESGRAADAATAALQLANTACCLIQLELDIPRCRSLVAEARRVPDRSARKTIWLSSTEGLLRRWDGDLDAAVPFLAEALQVARDSEDRWLEHKNLIFLTNVHLERGDAAAALAQTEELLSVAVKMGESGELPYVRALGALARAVARQPDAADRLATALDALRAFDSKAHLAYVLNAVSEGALTERDYRRVHRLATEALLAAEATHRVCEAVRSRALLARAAAAEGDRIGATAWLEPAVNLLADPDAVSAGARSAALLAAAEIGLRIPTLDQTLS